MRLCPGLMVRTTLLIPSRTCIQPPCARADRRKLIRSDPSAVPLRMVGWVPPTAKRKTTIERRRQLFEEAAEIIDREYAGGLSLDDVARRVASSRRQLQRAFLEAGETSYRSYLQRVRMARARDLLREGSLPVSEVASSVGYRQPAQFTKAFRRHHGAPPSSYRTAA
jgi:AraC family transcriptional regulator of adaptative response / methylphosphotriester-DNA alkyltransferase methyltransferase